MYSVPRDSTVPFFGADLGKLVAHPRQQVRPAATLAQQQNTGMRKESSTDAGG